MDRRRAPPLVEVEARYPPGLAYSV